MSIFRLSLCGATLFGATAFANDLTPLQLKAACETTPGNTITITAPLKVANFTTRVNVTTGCRIIMAATGKLETDSINMGFAGPLVIQGGTASGLAAAKSLIEARSVSIDLTGNDNFVVLGESTLRATAGGVTVNQGDKAKLEIASRHTARAHALMATGSINASGGLEFQAALSSTSLSGNGGIAISGSSDKPSIEIGNTNLIATAGAVTISSPGREATMNYAVGQIRAASGISVTFAGNEGQALLQQVTAAAGTGSLSVLTAVSGARPAKSIVLESVITAGGSVSVVAADTGNSGEAAMETSRVTATGAVEVRSGPLGTTNMKLNTLRSGVLVGAYTGPSGSCTAENNTIVSPAQSLCLP